MTALLEEKDAERQDLLEEVDLLRKDRMSLEAQSRETANQLEAALLFRVVITRAAPSPKRTWARSMLSSSASPRPLRFR